MKQITSILCLLLIAVIFMIVSGVSAPLTANQYVFNTYMYILLEIIIVGGVWLSLDDNQINLSGWNIVGCALLSFVSLFAIFSISPKSIVAKHTALAVFCISIGMVGYLTYQRNKYNLKLKKVFVSLIVVCGVLSLIAYQTPPNTTIGWMVPMMKVLCALIVVEIVDFLFFFNPKGNFITRFRIYNWIGVVLFSGFLLTDTHQLIRAANKISDLCGSSNQLDCADYPTQSLGIFLDVLNLFTNISNLSN